MTTLFYAASEASVWPSPPPKSDRRQLDRKAADLGATIKSQHAAKRVVQIDDISRQGCRVTADHLNSGDRVFIQINSLEPWLAEVRWVKDGQAGLAFSRPLHRAVVAHLSPISIV